MRYLCPKHQQTIWLNPDMAMALWNNAMASGTAAYRDADWRLARGFLGSAYETALLYLSNARYHRQGEFTVAHLIDAGRPLAQVLYSLKQLDEAEACLATLQSTLIQTSRHSRSDCRERMLRLTGRYVDDLASELQQMNSSACHPAAKPRSSADPGGHLH